MIDLSPKQRAALRGRAHPLHPVVSIGQHGLTEAVLREIDIALNAHELVKVRVHSDEREARAAMLDAIAAALSAAPVQHLGKLLVLWRPRPPEADVTPAKRPAKVAKTGKAVKTAKGVKRGAKVAPAPPRERKVASRRERGTAGVPAARAPAAGAADARGAPASRRRRGYRGRDAS